MTLPTLEQQEEMARWVGFTSIFDVDTGAEQKDVLAYPNGEVVNGRSWLWTNQLDFTDLSTLFQHVVPIKVPYWYMHNWHTEQGGLRVVRASVSKDMIHFKTATDESPGLALFWAVYHLVKEEK